MKVKYGDLPNRNFQNYISFLINKVYKILPMKEEGCKTLTSYLENLQIEMLGNYELIECLKDEPQFISVLGVIQYFIEHDFDVAICRRQVFSVIKSLENINKKYIEKN